MTIRQAIKLASDKLKRITDTPWLEAEVLLSYVLKINRTKLIVSSEKKLTPHQFRQFKHLIKRRLRREPVAYITGHKEFYGLDFHVSRKVMIPRPETEILVEETLKLFQIPNLKFRGIADIGTGSGCIAIALAKTILALFHDRKLMLSRVRMYATDVSEDILNVAKMNARTHKVLSKITFLKGSLLAPLKNHKIEIIVANLPYLTTKQWLSCAPEIKQYEPRSALDGGKDGLDYIKKLLYQAHQRKDIKVILLEIGGKRQVNKIKKIARVFWPKSKIKIKKDLRELDRVIVIFI